GGAAARALPAPAVWHRAAIPPRVRSGSPRAVTGRGVADQDLFSLSRFSASVEIFGLGSSWDRPFQARLTRCAAISSSLGLRTSSHHWPANATMPTIISEYTGAR